MNAREFIRSTFLHAAAVCFALVSVSAWAQPADLTTGRAVYHDTSQRLDHMPQGIPGRPGENRQIPNNPRVRPPRFPDLAAPDGGVQQQASSPSQLGPTPGPIVSASGLSADNDAQILGTRYVPPDINGDIGLDGNNNRIFIQYINSIWGIFDVSGALIAGPYKGNTFWQGFGGYCQTNNDGDPVVLYDDQAGRWVFSQFSISEGIQCVAVSTTSDPLGPYHRYAFLVSPGKQNDYPKLGVWSDGTTGSTGQSAYTFTTRDFPCCSSGFMGTGVMERDQMLVGGPAQFIKFTNACVANECIEGQLPPHLAGSPPPAGTCPVFWSAVDAAYDDAPYSNDGYRNHQICVDWSNLNNSTYTEGGYVLAGSNFDRFLGNINPVLGGEQLNSLPYFTMYRAQYRWFGTYASVVLNTTVDAGSERAGIRWAEIQSSDGDSGWQLQQDSTYAPDDGLERWMGSIAQDGDGNIALGFSVAGSSQFPSIRYATRMAGDTPGTLAGGEASCVEGTGAQAANSYNRWGDYSSMSIDPTDDCTFWYTQEYYETTGAFDWNTRICSFQIPGCGGAPFNYPPQVTISNPADGSEFDAGVDVTFSATATDAEDAGISADDIEWTVDGGFAANGAEFTTSTLSVGSHQVTASVIDSGGKTGSDSVQITIVAAPTNVHVASVVTGTVNANRGNKWGTATVTIVNDLGQPASGYMVSGEFSGTFNETVIPGSTNANGQVTFQTTLPPQKNPTVAFCVSNVIGDLDYVWEDSASGTTCGAPPGPQPPTVTITSPADGSDVVQGDSVTVTATAIDPEDGDLSASIAWTLDGASIGIPGDNTVIDTSGMTVPSSHTVGASVTDGSGLPGSDSISFNVVGSLSGVVMHVGDLQGIGAAGRPGRWDATVTVTVHDALENLIEGATVSGSWSNGASGSGNCPTDANGQCSITKTNIKTNVSTVTFSVTGITRNAADTYDAVANDVSSSINVVQ